MSGPKGAKISPHGNWIVMGNLPGGKLMLCKDSTVIVAPITDVRKVGDYSVDHMMKQIKEVKEMNNVEEGREERTEQ